MKVYVSLSWVSHESLFDIFSLKANCFTVKFPAYTHDEPNNPLMFGFSEIAEIPNIKIQSADAFMKGAIQIAGILSDDTKGIIRKLIKNDCLWDYELKSDDIIHMAVSDFNDCILNLSENEFHALKSKGIIKYEDIL